MNDKCIVNTVARPVTTVSSISDPTLDLTKLTQSLKLASVVKTSAVSESGERQCGDKRMNQRMIEMEE